MLERAEGGGRGGDEKRVDKRGRSRWCVWGWVDRWIEMVCRIGCVEEYVRIGEVC